MWKIHRYYFKEVAVNAALTFGVLFAIVLIAMVARGIQRAVGGSLTDAALITFFWTVDTFPHLLTIAVLFGTISTFARASQDREITALRSAGISPRVPMTAAMLVGVICSLGGSYLMHQLVPYAHFKKYRIGAEVIRNLILNLNLQGDTIPLGESMTMSFRERDGTEFRNCTIFIRDGADDHTMFKGMPVVVADEVRYSVPDGSEVILVEFKDVRDPLRGISLAAPTMRVPLREITEQDRRNEADKDIASDQLIAEVERGVHEQPGAAAYHVHRRGCFALMAALFAPIGFCLGVASRERGRMTAMLFGLVPLALFYVIDVLAGKFVAQYDQPLFAWAPALAIVLVGTPFCWRLLRL